MKRTKIIIICCVFLLLLTGCQSKKQEDALKIYQNICADYDEVMRVIYHGLVEVGEEITDENGFPYFVLQEEKYNEITEIKDLLVSVFSEKYIEEHLTWVYEGESPLYKEIEGNLCIAMKDAAGGALPKEYVSTLEVSDEQMILLMKKTDETDETYKIYLTKCADRWVIDNIMPGL